MFSYRHAFHAGNHADVLKHITLIATLRHLMQKEAGITLVDTHAGAGLYRLDGDYTETGGEAKDGVVKLMAALRPAGAAPVAAAPVIDDYLDLIASYNPSGLLRVYPGSPFVLHSLLRTESRDKLKLFELHPTDSRTLNANIAQLEAGRQIAVALQDGFEGVKPLLPPPPSATGSTSAPSDRCRAVRARRLSGRLCRCTSKPMNNSKKPLVNLPGNFIGADAITG